MSRPVSVAARIASLLVAIENCEKSGNTEWKLRHSERLETVEKNCLPHGSGIDSEPAIDRDKTTPSRLVIQASFHHMNDAGMYDGWTHHSIIATPDFDGINIRVTGRDRNQIKEYLAEIFHAALSELAPEYE